MSDNLYDSGLPPELEIINGVNQITTIVSGYDERQAKTKLKNQYFIGQFYTAPNDVVDYDHFNLYSNTNIQWTASEKDNPLWNDITFSDVREADSAYETHTKKQQCQIDWVRGLAIQKGYYSFFCIDEPDWVCAAIPPFPTDDTDEYLAAIIDDTLDPITENTYESAVIDSIKLPYRGNRQQISTVLLK